MCSRMHVKSAVRVSQRATPRSACQSPAQQVRGWRRGLPSRADSPSRRTGDRSTRRRRRGPSAASPGGPRSKNYQRPAGPGPKTVSARTRPTNGAASSHNRQYRDSRASRAPGLRSLGGLLSLGGEGLRTSGAYEGRRAAYEGRSRFSSRLLSTSKRHRLRMPVRRSSCPVPPGDEVQTSARNQRSNESNESGHPICLTRGGDTEQPNHHDYYYSHDEQWPADIRLSGLRHRWSPPRYDPPIQSFHLDEMPQGAEGPSSVRPIARLADQWRPLAGCRPAPRRRPILLAVDQEVQELSGGHPRE